jgi:NADPH-dependent curcumin reductase CurA
VTAYFGLLEVGQPQSGDLGAALSGKRLICIAPEG